MMPAAEERTDRLNLARDGHDLKRATPQLLRSREAAKVLSISERTLWQLTNSGAIKTVRIGRALRIAEEDLLAFIKANKSNGGAA